MANTLPDSLILTLNRQPVFYIRENEVLSPKIKISPIADTEFNVPVYTQADVDDAPIRELQAQGVDKLADSLQEVLDSLHEHEYAGMVMATLGDEIARCRSFAEELRHPLAGGVHDYQ